MRWGEEQYSKISLVVGVKILYYQVDVYVSENKNQMLDFFPSITMGQMCDLVYCINTDKFLKFRWEYTLEPIYKDFFESGLIRKVSLHELKDIIEREYNTYIHVYNEEKWQKFNIPVSELD